jgi:nucleoside-diphosphate-sugar epimerase
VNLRLANVYGPFAKILMVRPIEHLARGTLVVVGADEKPSNTIYVDNVAEAIVRALDAPDETVVGEIFALSAEDDLSWGDFYRYFAGELGVPLPTCLDRPQAQAKRRGPGPIGWGPTLYRGVAEVATSREFRSLGRKVLETPPFGGPPQWLGARVPALATIARKVLKMDTPLVYNDPCDKPPGSDDLMIMDPNPAFVSIEKARRRLGYHPVVSRSRGMELTLEWLRLAHPAFRGQSSPTSVRA